MTEYIERTYRGVTNDERYASFELAVFETDLKVYVDKKLEKQLDRIKPLTQAYAEALRGELEAYIVRNPEFVTTLEPWQDDEVRSPVVRAMIDAGNAAGVGPMAAVAGVLAEAGARYLQNFSKSVIVENGGTCL